MGLKIFGVGTTDQKSNNLLRGPQDLRDGRNIMVDINGEYIKRPGTENDVIFAPYHVNANGHNSNLVFIKSLNEYFYSDGINYHKIKDGVDVTIPGNIGAELNVTTSIQGAEYLNTFIFTHQSNQLGTYKYDSRGVYRAGLPTPVISGTTAGAFFLLSFFEFIDHQGNTIYGPATITSGVASTTSITFNTFRDPATTGFFQNDIMRVSLVGGTSKTINKTANTLVLASAPSVSVGDYVIIRNNFLEFPSATNGVPGITISKQSGTNGTEAQDFFLRLKVTAYNPATLTVTFDPDSFTDREITILASVTGIYNILHNTVLRTFISSSEVTGYEGPISQYSIRMTNEITTNTRSIVLTSGPNTVLLSDTYDITTSKLRPPKCKYIYTYGYQLVFVQVQSVWDFTNKENNYTNNDLVMYSDTSNGDLGENISEINRQLVGNTYDGELTGGIRVQDSFLVFKNRSLFSLDGILIPGQFTLRKIETNEIGCVSESSILSIPDMVLFQGQDGIYSTNGYKCIKASTDIDPFFKTIDPSLTRSVIDNKNEVYLFWTNQGIVVFDYVNKKIFIWNNILAVNGITVNNDGGIRFHGALSSKNFIIAKNDSGVAIPAYIDTAWFDLSEPGLLKKATDVRIYSFKNQGQVFSLTYFLDWTESKFKGPYEGNMSDSTIKSLHKNLDIIQSQSFSFRFENNNINEDLNISGYEISAAIIQTRDKNVK